MWETWDLWERAVMIKAFQVDQAWESRVVVFVEEGDGVGDDDHDSAKVGQDDFSGLLGS